MKEDNPDERSSTSLDEPGGEIPEFLDLNEFQKQTLPELFAMGESLHLRVNSRTKPQLVFDILTCLSRKGTVIEAEGVLEMAGDNFGLLRWPSSNFRPQADDVYVSSNIIRKHALRRGTRLRASVRAPRDREKYLSADKILTIEGEEPETFDPGEPFDKLTAMFPSERIVLENKELASAACRVVDIIAPLGKGQRGIIVAPPRAGKTILLKSIAQAISHNNPEIELVILLLDERPEEVTDFRESVERASIYSSTFDEPATRHVELAEFVLERARRLVEQQKDVVILLDSLTRLSRGYNNMMGGGGRTLSGGLDAKAMIKPKKFFGSARKVEGGGSLTILATALIETDSRLDEVIFEEFKGTGNMELHLDRELGEQRIYPAIHISKSGTRKDELLYHPDEFKRVALLRKQLAQMPAPDAMEILLKNIKKTQANAEILLSGLQLMG